MTVKVEPPAYHPPYHGHSHAMHYATPYPHGPPAPHPPPGAIYDHYYSSVVPGPRPTLPSPIVQRIPAPPNNKRSAPSDPRGQTGPKKKQSKWTPEEDKVIIDLRQNGMKWDDISKHVGDRSAISCRLRYQNYLERRSEWGEEDKNKFARLYERYRQDMWKMIAKDLQVPWRACEAIHWQMGEYDIAERANVQHHFELHKQPPNPGVPVDHESVSPYGHNVVPYSLPPQNHPVAHLPTPQRQSLSPPDGPYARDSRSSPAEHPHCRSRVNSMHNGPTTTQGMLPSISEVTGPPIMAPVHPHNSHHVPPPHNVRNPQNTLPRPSLSPDAVRK